MPTIVRRFEFDYGHRVLGHEGKCNNYHGHRAVVELTVAAPALDTLGRVLDFSVVKSIVGGWIDAALDHAMILHKSDPLLPVLRGEQPCGNAGLLAPLRVFELPCQSTAENLATLILDNARSLLAPCGVSALKVVFYETPNCCAETE